LKRKELATDELSGHVHHDSQVRFQQKTTLLVITAQEPPMIPTDAVYTVISLCFRDITSEQANYVHICCLCWQRTRFLNWNTASLLYKRVPPLPDSD